MQCCNCNPPSNDGSSYWLQESFVSSNITVKAKAPQEGPSLKSLSTAMVVLPPLSCPRCSSLHGFLLAFVPMRAVTVLFILSRRTNAFRIQANNSGAASEEAAEIFSSGTIVRSVICDEGGSHPGTPKHRPEDSATNLAEVECHVLYSIRSLEVSYFCYCHSEL